MDIVTDAEHCGAWAHVPLLTNMERLVIAVAAHPELYDVTYPLYNDRHIKDRA